MPLSLLTSSLHCLATVLTPKNWTVKRPLPKDIGLRSSPFLPISRLKLDGSQIAQGRVNALAVVNITNEVTDLLMVYVLLHIRLRLAQYFLWEAMQ